MKLVLSFNGRAQIRIIYTPEEWEVFRSKLESLGLTVAITNRGFGESFTTKFYRESDCELKRFIFSSLSEFSEIYDDINSPVIENNQINIALFRVIPEPNGNSLVASAPIGKYLTILQLRELQRVYAKVYETIINTVGGSGEVEIAINFRRESL